ncbi:hypothetical protein [Siminovitchia terrae]|uniref:hypothetical protein n=1 Tax=Siminovitchia terrae TaxID=1914933 RepID=UPI001BB3F591|nr:hypothetical protein [Siminovitchia terrae]
MNRYYQDPYGYPMMPIQHGAERILGRPWDAGSDIVFFHFSGEREFGNRTITCSVPSIYQKISQEMLVFCLIFIQSFNQMSLGVFAPRFYRALLVKFPLKI